MSDSIIQVRGIGKSYKISHEGGKESYTALRDVLAKQAKKIFSFPKSLRNEGGLKKANTEEFWALKDVSFDIQQGDRVGIIGRNGAGKSTLLKILSRITEPTTGEIRIKGRVASLLEVGTGFHPELTGRENIYLNGAVLGMSRAEIKRKFDEIVDFAEVEKFLDTPVKRYSSGMYVRLAFAVAAHLEPEILVVDEVLAVGDAQFQKKCLGKMEDVSKNEGRTVLFVSHNLSALRSLCNMGVFLQNGILLSHGELNETIKLYSNFDQDFLTTWCNSEKKVYSDIINISSVKIEPENESAGFTIDNSLVIKINFEIKLESELLFDIHLYNSDNLLVFDSCSSPKLYPIGFGDIKGVIPKSIFNDGQYYIDLMVVLNHTIPLFKVTRILRFELAEASREIKWYGKWPGIMRPKLTWI